MQRRLAELAAIVATAPLWLAPTPAMAAATLLPVTSWFYQLQNLDLAVVAESDYDLIVIDYSRDGSGEAALSADEVASLKVKPDGSRRIVLAYFSIGEAEDYRDYWNQDWYRQSPAWLMNENPDWEGNYEVRFWDQDWQSILFGAPGSYLDRILLAEFDGVYLDRVDAFERADPEMGRAQRAAQMVALVRAIASYARSKIPGFLIVPQNGEELLADGSYRQTIDGFGKEDLLYGIDGDEQRNRNGDIRASLDYIRRFTSAGKPVFLVEYLHSAKAIAQAQSDATTLGFILFIADRELDHAYAR